jgi:hypothetical protein
MLTLCRHLPAHGALLQAFVQRAGYDYVRLDGSTPQKARQPLVDQFNGRSSIFLFLMSTVAGGVGINLTAANKVVSTLSVPNDPGLCIYDVRMHHDDAVGFRKVV